MPLIVPNDLDRNTQLREAVQTVELGAHVARFLHPERRQVLQIDGFLQTLQRADIRQEKSSFSASSRV